GSSQPLAPPPTLPVPATQPQQSGNFQSTPNDDSGSVCQQPPTAGVICPVCNRQLINEQALRSHFSTHPVEANNARLRSCHQANSQTSSPDSDEQPPNTPLHDECNQWYHQFNGILNDFANFDFHHFD